jgi:hypothetical protein
MTCSRFVVQCRADWGMRCAHRTPFQARAFALGASHWPKATLQAALPKGGGVLATPFKTPLGSRANGPAALGYRRPAARLRRFLLVGLRPKGRSPRGFFLGGDVTSFARFWLSSWLIPPEVCPGSVPPARGVHKKARTSCLRIFYKASPFIRPISRAAIFRAWNSSKHGEQERSVSPRKIFFEGRNLSNPVNFKTKSNAQSARRGNQKCRSKRPNKGA